MYYLSFALVMLVPIVMLVIGVRWYLKPPAFKAPGIAYRTEVTERSPAVWEFAHTHCGKLWARFGAMSAVICGALMVVFRGSYQKFVLWMLCAQMLLLCITIFMIDYLSKGLFDENGVRIEDKKPLPQELQTVPNGNGDAPEHTGGEDGAQAARAEDALQ